MGNRRIGTRRLESAMDNVVMIVLLPAAATVQHYNNLIFYTCATFVYLVCICICAFDAYLPWCVLAVHVLTSHV